MSVAENLAAIRQRIDEAARAGGRDPAAVRLVAVSKKQPDARVLEAYAAGHRLFGENYVQGLVARRALLPGAEWHMIGHVQTNKAKHVAAAADLVHTVDSERLARLLAGRPALLEINVGGEGAKSGVLPAEAEALLEAARPHVEVRGLMCIPPPDDAPRPHFAALRALRDRLAAASGLPLPELSMGMSADFEAAILEGATLVRVGTAIFGERG